MMSRKCCLPSLDVNLVRCHQGAQQSFMDTVRWCCCSLYMRLSDGAAGLVGGCVHLDIGLGPRQASLITDSLLKVVLFYCSAINPCYNSEPLTPGLQQFLDSISNRTTHIKYTHILALFLSLAYLHTQSVSENWFGV